MAVDLLRGIRLELTRLGGKLGRELGVPTPTHNTIYAATKPYASGRQPGWVATVASAAHLWSSAGAPDFLV
jgi:hypothetical protein